MADEFKITQTLIYENGQLRTEFTPSQTNLSQSTQGFTERTITVNSSVEADVDVSLDIATLGMCILESLEATTTGNFVKYGAKSSTGGIAVLAHLGPTEKHMLKLSSTVSAATALRWQSDTAAVNVHLTVFEQ